MGSYSSFTDTNILTIHDHPSVQYQIIVSRWFVAIATSLPSSPAAKRKH